MSALVPAAAAAAAGDLWATSDLTACYIPVFGLLALGIACSAAPAQRTGAGIVLVLVCCGLSAGMLTGRIASRGSSETLPVPLGSLVSVEGTVLDARLDGHDRVLILRLSTAGSRWVSGTAEGEIAVRLAGAPELLAGDEVRISPVAQDSLWRDRSGRLWARAELEHREEPGPLSLVASSAGARRSIRDAIDATAGTAAPLLAALLLGDAGSVDPRVDLLFRRSGAVHLLALSGMHLAVIAMLVRAVFRRTAGPRPAMVLSLAAAVLYVMLVGPRPGLVRACLLVGFATLAGIADRRRPLLELLAAAFLVHIIVQPASVSSLGFQLSYLSLLGICVVAAPLSGLGRRWVPRAIAGPLAAGTGAQLVTMPLLLARFGQWFPAGVIATIVMGPLVLLFMSAGLVAVLVALAGVPAIAAISVPALEVLYRVIAGAGWLFAALPAIAPSNPDALIAVGLGIAAVALSCGLVYQYRGTDRV